MVFCSSQVEATSARTAQQVAMREMGFTSQARPFLVRLWCVFASLQSYAESLKGP
jgi:hypothetical protein